MAKGNQRKVDEQPMFFSAFNYKLIGIAVLLIFSGFAAMLMENEVDGLVSLYISPLVILAGYIIVVFAIMKHDRDEPKSKEQEAAS